MTGTLTAPALLSDQDVYYRRVFRYEALSDRELLLSATCPLEVLVEEIDGTQPSMYIAIGESGINPLLEVEEALGSTAPRWIARVAKRSAELLTLPDGWDTYGSSRVNPRAAAYALRLLLLISSTNTPAPSLVPLADGGVQVEWHTDGADLEVEVAANGVLSIYSVVGGTEDEWESDFYPAIERLESLVAGLS